MSLETKVQRIERKNTEQWYVGFPKALAQTLELDKGEVVEWIIKDKNTLTLQRKSRIPSRRRVLENHY